MTWLNAPYRTLDALRTLCAYVGVPADTEDIEELKAEINSHISTRVEGHLEYDSGISWSQLGETPAEEPVDYLGPVWEDLPNMEEAPPDPFVMPRPPTDDDPEEVSDIQQELLEELEAAYDDIDNLVAEMMTLTRQSGETDEELERVRKERDNLQEGLKQIISEILLSVTRTPSHQSEENQIKPNQINQGEASMTDPRAQQQGNRPDTRWQCPRCQRLNGQTARYCGGCSYDNEVQQQIRQDAPPPTATPRASVPEREEPNRITRENIERHSRGEDLVEVVVNNVRIQVSREDAIKLQYEQQLREMRDAAKAEAERQERAAGRSQPPFASTPAEPTQQPPSVPAPVAPPPLPQERKEWWYVIGEERNSDPVSLQDLIDEISFWQPGQPTLVWKQGMTNWAKPEDVPEIKALLPKPERPAPEQRERRRPVDPPAAPKADKPKSGWDKLPSWMRK